jgi:xylan 1,4-beta-xylosidase
MKEKSTLHIYKSFYLFLLMLATVTVQAQKPKAVEQTFCNPINIPYNFQVDGGVTRREAADPVMVLYKDKYWLFASKQAGYWYSDDMVNWHFIKPEGLPLEVYAPSVEVVDGKLCYTAGGTKGTYTTDDPFKGIWKNICGYKRGASDPDVMQDTDGKVYLYDGCSDKTPLRFTELDRKTFQPLTPAYPVIYADVTHHGWEVAGDDNRGRIEGDLTSNKSVAPWIEGSFVNKINDLYYWQYAAPGTQYHSYADGVYISAKPTGPFVYQGYSPFSFKPTGFITGAGHSCTYADKNGEYWHISSGVISVRHIFERRLCIFPMGVMPDGQLVTNTYLGDYPQYAPGITKNHLRCNRPKWMLLSYDKPATASSTLTSTRQNFEVKNAFDENIQTWWSAATGNKGEWLQVDLKKPCRVNALQVNFADQDCSLTAPLANDGYKYFIEASADKKHWTRIVNKTKKAEDAPHDYTPLNEPVMARYLRLVNVHYPANGRFSVYDFRVFGSALGKIPQQVSQVSVARSGQDQRTAHISWQPVPHADFYIVRYGIEPDRLFSCYQVYKGDSIDINALNTGVNYYFTVDAVNGNGIAKGKEPEADNKY